MSAIAESLRNLAALMCDPLESAGRDGYYWAGQVDAILAKHAAEQPAQGVPVDDLRLGLGQIAVGIADDPTMVTCCRMIDELLAASPAPATTKESSGVRSAPAAPGVPEGDLRAEIERLNAIINTPQGDDFLRAVSTEAEHQRQRWGTSHDSGKSPADWFWLIGYLAGKALHSHLSGDTGKAEHHVITTAAACANWHRAMFGRTDIRPGIDGEAAIAAAPAPEVSRG